MRSVGSKRKERLRNVHPGSVLVNEFMVPLQLSHVQVANAARLPVSQIVDLAEERQAITPDIALRLGRLFGVDPEIWVNLQAAYDMEEVRRANPD